MLSDKKRFEVLYQDVPIDEKQSLIKFRESHPIKQIKFNGYSWKYLVVNSHESTIIFLPGATGTGEGFFRIMESLASVYKSIALSYPPVNTIDEIINGILKIMDAEDVLKAIFLGTSWGGVIAQCFNRSYPDKVEKLILSNSLFPDPSFSKRNIIKDILLRIIPNTYLKQASIKAMKKRYLPLIPEDDRAFWSAYFQEMIENEYDKKMIFSIQNSFNSIINKYNFTPNDLKNTNILIIEADDDQAVDYFGREKLKQMYPHASVYTFHNTGHLIITSKPQEYLKVLIKYLEH